MNIQISVVIWTVICFVILMVILRNLLFKPIFEIMDKRNEKLKKAEEKKLQESLLIEEHEKRLEILKADAKIQRENFIKSELDIISVKSKTDIETVKAQRLEKIEAYKKATEDEKQEICSAFNKNCEKIAKAFAERIISGN